MQKTVIIALAVIGTLTAGFFLLKGHKTQSDTSVSDIQSVYNQWKVDFNIQVGASEDTYRLAVFTRNYKKINTHNSIVDRTFDMGLNAFSHLTPEEFSATHLGLKPKVGAHATRKNFENLTEEGIPTKVDWTSKLNPVKNQGQCGSCWAFSTVGAIEGLHSVKNGNLYDLSEQELVDCSTSFGNQGCDGGLMDQGFQYVISVGGLASEQAYPYTAADGDCQTVTSRQGKISSFVDVKTNNPAALKAAIAQQPVSVAIEADTDIFQSYQSGVITSKSCGTQLDHGVVAVGYDTTGKTPYYIVRNSWGASWGLKGYVNIGISNGAGICGIQLDPSYPTL